MDNVTSLCSASINVKALIFLNLIFSSLGKKLTKRIKYLLPVLGTRLTYLVKVINKTVISDFISSCLL